MATYYITKYALSTGKLMVAEGQPSSYDPKYIKLDDEQYRWTSFTLNKDAFENRAQAMIALGKACAKKIASLKKQIAKIESMPFEE